MFLGVARFNITLLWIIIIALNIQGEYLSYNPKLDEVAKYRQENPTAHPINKNININHYECLLGLPYGYGYLIGKEVYFISDKVYGPWLVVDVESKNHNGIMNENNLIADINCKDMVHKKGKLRRLIMPFYNNKSSEKLKINREYAEPKREPQWEELKWTDIPSVEMEWGGPFLVDREARQELKDQEEIRRKIQEKIDKELNKVYSEPLTVESVSWSPVSTSNWQTIPVENNNLYGYRYNYYSYNPLSNKDHYQSWLDENRKDRKNRQLLRIEPILEDKNEMKYFYMPNGCGYKIILGAIETIYGKEYEYNLTELELTYKDLPSFERKLVMGIK